MASDTVDAFLLDKHQDYSEYQQIETGRNCYRMGYEVFRIGEVCDFYIPISIVPFMYVAGEVFLATLIMVLIPVNWFRTSRYRRSMQILKNQQDKIPGPPAKVRKDGLAATWFLLAVWTFLTISSVFD